MRYQSLIISLVIIAFLGNFVTLALFIASDFWHRPLSAEATSESSLYLTILSSNSSNVTNDTSPPSGDAGGSGGGGGGGTSSSGSGGSEFVPSASFTLYPTELRLFLISGGMENHSFILANVGRSMASLNITVTGIESLITPLPQEINLAPGESRELFFTLRAPQNGIYGGKIVVRSGDIHKDLFILVNVRSANALFDVLLTIPESLKVIRSGKFLRTTISISQVGPPEDTSVVASYYIKDFLGNTLYTENETFQVKGSRNYIKEFDTHGLTKGDYLAGVEITYPQGFASSSAYFVVVSYLFDYFILALIILLVLSLVVLFYSFRAYRRSKELRASVSLRGVKRT